MSCRDLETSVTEYFFHKKALEKLHCKVFVSMFKKIVPDNPCPHRLSHHQQHPPPLPAELKTQLRRLRFLAAQALTEKNKL